MHECVCVGLREWDCVRVCVRGRGIDGESVCIGVGETSSVSMFQMLDEIWGMGE